MRRQRLFILSLIFIVILLFIGYYIFYINSDALLVKAKVKDIDVIFYKIDKIEEMGSTDASAVIDNSKKRIYIDVPNLMGKGSYAKIPITIKNIGIKPAKLESIYEYGLDDSKPISVKYRGIGVTDKVLMPNEEAKFYVIVSLNDDITFQSISTNIEIRFNYIQSRR